MIPVRIGVIPVRIGAILVKIGAILVRSGVILVRIGVILVGIGLIGVGFGRDARIGQPAAVSGAFGRDLGQPPVKNAIRPDQGPARATRLKKACARP